VLTVIIPAHNESQVIGRLLDRLMPVAGQRDLDIIVAANGCTDDTAGVAAAYGTPVRVLTVPAADKRAALDAGDEAATGFPRIYLDADVVLGAEDLLALARALEAPGVLAAGPVRVIDVTRSAWPVRWYYTIWDRLPVVQTGLFGRGVVAVNEHGYERISELPPLLADDLAASLAFDPDERVVVPDARVIVYGPRTVRDLIRRRIRVATGVSQIEGSAEAPESSARTSGRDLYRIASDDPRLMPQLLVFLIVTVIARAKSRNPKRRHDYTTWLRDESSRAS
jgi:glycosyltransferase involved in cell wall biosynthesis